MKRALSLAWQTLCVAGTLFAIVWSVAMLVAFPPEDALRRRGKR